MKKRLLTTTVLIALLVGGGYFLLRPQLAIREAKNYKVPQGTACLDVITPAVHPATGATYTFSSSCMPDDWQPANR